MSSVAKCMNELIMVVSWLVVTENESLDGVFWANKLVLIYQKEEDDRQKTWKRRKLLEGGKFSRMSFIARLHSRIRYNYKFHKI